MDGSGVYLEGSEAAKGICCIFTNSHTIYATANFNVFETH